MQRSRNQISGLIAQDANSFSNEQTTGLNAVRKLFAFGARRTVNHREDAMLGGHMVVHDNGALNQHLQGIEANSGWEGVRRPKPWYNLGSSHYPNSVAQQSELQMPVTNNHNFGTILHGTTPQGHSWIQMEAHSGVMSVNGGGGRAAVDYAAHANDYAQYQYFGQNIGPLGRSNFTEANPLVVSANQVRMYNRIQAFGQLFAGRDQRVNAANNPNPQTVRQVNHARAQQNQLAADGIADYQHRAQGRANIQQRVQAYAPVLGRANIQQRARGFAPLFGNRRDPAANNPQLNPPQQSVRQRAQAFAPIFAQSMANRQNNR